MLIEFLKSIENYKIDLNEYSLKNLYIILGWHLTNSEYFTLLNASYKNFNTSGIYDIINYNIKNLIKFITLEHIKKYNILINDNNFLEGSEIEKLADSFTALNEVLYWNNYNIKINKTYLKDCQLYECSIGLFYEDTRSIKKIIDINLGKDILKSEDFSKNYDAMEFRIAMHEFFYNNLTK